MPMDLGEGDGAVDRRSARGGGRDLPVFSRATAGGVRLRRFGRLRPGRSDIDFLVEFEADVPGSALGAYFGLKDELEALFGRPIDLVMPRAVRTRT
jgi:hypothetical protein